MFGSQKAIFVTKWHKNNATLGRSKFLKLNFGSLLLRPNYRAYPDFLLHWEDLKSGDRHLFYNGFPPN